MNTISAWFSSLDPTLRIYWGIAIFASVVFTIQTVMSFIGIGDFDSDMDVDMDGTPDVDSLDDAGVMHMLSIRNIIYFLLGLGWAGVCLWNTIGNHTLLLAVSILVGCLFVACFIFVFRQLMKLQQNGAVNINDSIGRVCDVYLRIPANAEGMGQIQISLGGSVHEFDARTNGEEEIPSGTKVRVVEVVEHILVVEKV